jgi:hypothetical protein
MRSLTKQPASDNDERSLRTYAVDLNTFRNPQKSAPTVQAGQSNGLIIIMIRMITTIYAFTS